MNTYAEQARTAAQAWVSATGREKFHAAFGRFLEQNREAFHEAVARYTSCPETGFREERTAALFAEEVRGLGLEPETGLAMTGLRVRLQGKVKTPEGVKRPCLAWIGELDALPCPKQEHFPVSDRGVTHACGHGIQMAVLSMGLRFFVQSGVLEHLAGDLVFYAVPAEELIELEYRLKLKEEGKLKHYCSGKQELIASGLFEGIDFAFMFHALPDQPDDLVTLQSPSLGFISKTVDFIGKASHAAGAPEQGINALHAANLAWQAIQCLREAFRDEDRVRVHGVVLRGGEAVNVIPDLVSYEMVVRAATLEPLKAVNEKVNTAITHAALAVGARAKIRDLPGYLPMEQNEPMNRWFEAICASEGLRTEWGAPFPGSTDMGDLGTVLPVVQLSIPGYASPLHSKDFRITNFAAAVELPCRLLSEAAYAWLSDGGEEARRIISSKKRLTVEEYQELWPDILGDKKP